MRLVLVAASGLALEALAAVRASDQLDDAVVVDDDPSHWGTTLAGVPVVGGLEQVRRLSGYQLLVCAGRGSSRASIVGRLSGMGIGHGRFATVVHPAVEVPLGCFVGGGSIILNGAVLTANVRVGHHVVVMPQAVLTHDDVVDDYATICAGVTLGGRVRVGRGAYLGMSSSVREGRVVGAGAVLGMGAALTVDLPPGQTWVGIPARRMRQAATTSAGWSGKEGFAS
jgi:sugar O-acyltransferase (sialic acid O-acetyltransferase NeuD family)